VWHVPEDSLDSALTESLPIIDEIRKSLPIYHSCAMLSEFINKFGRVTPRVQPAVLRYFYRDLTGDCSSNESLSQEELDERMKQAIEMKDPHLVIDLGQCVCVCHVWPSYTGEGGEGPGFPHKS